MAVAAVGEAFLSGFIEVILDRLASPQVVNLIRGNKVDANLVQRSFFQRSNSGNLNQHFVMHDMVHDLATLLAAEFYFRTEKLGKETKIVLKSLVIRDCPRLQGNLPTHLPALETLQIEKCNQLTFSLTKVPAIRKLVILESNKVSLHEIPLLLEQLKIQGREVTESFFEAIAITPPNSLQSLEIHDCSSRISFPGDYLLPSLRILTITGCRNLDFPKQNHLHELLQQLSIVKSCDSLLTLPLDPLPNLRSLYISQCTNLECLSLSKILPNLHDFTIQSCPKLVSFPVEGLIAPNLTSFNIYKCVSLKSLPCHVSTLLPKLDTVTIYDCPEMETFPERGMPHSLRSLYITNCEILLRNLSLTSMDMLTRLSITGPCNGVRLSQFVVQGRIDAQYHVPRSWFKQSGKVLAIFETKDGDPRDLWNPFWENWSLLTLREITTILILALLLKRCVNKSDYVIKLIEENFKTNLCPGLSTKLAGEAVCNW
ncbi:hypothetical protein P8452_15584 [Trifolium repens]|nr:hypothetical protein P8452_15584 [Trifolium repens]